MTIVNSSNVSKELKRLNITEGDLSLLFNASENAVLSFLDKDTDGVILGQIINPIEKVGIYVPGGTAAYPSTVLMNAVPAKVAGVEEIVMVTPPNEDGTISDVILAAAKIAGVTKIFKVGGAQISTKHAGFVVNSGQATAKDVLELIDAVQQRVYEKHGVKLYPEVRMIGDQ